MERYPGPELPGDQRVSIATFVYLHDALKQRRDDPEWKTIQVVTDVDEMSSALGHALVVSVIRDEEFSDPKLEAHYFTFNRDTMDLASEPVIFHAYKEKGKSVFVLDGVDRLDNEDCLSIASMVKMARERNHDPDINQPDPEIIKVLQEQYLDTLAGMYPAGSEDGKLPGEVHELLNTIFENGSDRLFDEDTLALRAADDEAVSIVRRDRLDEYHADIFNPSTGAYDCYALGQATSERVHLGEVNIFMEVPDPRTLASITKIVLTGEKLTADEYGIVDEKITEIVRDAEREEPEDPDDLIYNFDSSPVVASVEDV